MRLIRNGLITLSLSSALSLSPIAHPLAIGAEATPDNRIASLFLSEDLINEQLALHVKSALVKELKVNLDPDHGQIFLRGKLQVPVEELRAVNLDPKFGAFRFQLTVKPEINSKGYFILEFPLAETYFYPEASTDHVHDRVIIPVQLLSLALASVRGYLSVLSGDFSSFDRRTQKLNTEMKVLRREIAGEKNSEALARLKNQREAIRLQLAAVPVERKQLEAVAKNVEHILGFTGEKELNLNDELGARKNALILKLKPEQLTPYLAGIELGGLRIRHDKNDGNGETYLVIDINSVLAKPLPPHETENPSPRPGMKTAPALIVRLNQSLFESEAVVNAEKKKLESKIRDLDIQLRDDGLHVAGQFKTFFVNIPFDTIVNFVTTGTDVFEARVREVKVAGLDFEFLTGFALEAIQSRLDKALRGLCTFEYVGQEKDRSRAVKVTLNAQKMIPAFPHLHLVEVDVRDREMLFKLGTP